MNTLAHLYLSGIDPERLLGNFIGDSVRGSEFTNLPPGVQRGQGLCDHAVLEGATADRPDGPPVREDEHPRPAGAGSGAMASDHRGQGHRLSPLDGSDCFS